MSATVAHVQVHKRVRRPVTADTFMAVEVRDDGRFLHVRGCWRNSTEERSYIFPASSIVAVRLIEATA